MNSPLYVRRPYMSGAPICKVTLPMLVAKTDPSTPPPPPRQISGVQVTFQNQVKSLCSVIKEMGNPFLEQSKDLLVLRTRDIMDSSVAETVRIIKEIGKAQYQAFLTERREKRTTSQFDPVKKNKFSLFSSPHPSKAKSSDKMQIASLKSNCSLCTPVRFLPSS